ncbi:hypothetical protein COL08_22990 [Priestia megaterium]|uniref:coiled-coil domain-containing protein n=1 Tax=Priestia megaterium TaxID=1404 RepID=UPI000BF4DDE0|nr:hypothetical protein [Priestia megaterium]PFV93062.1 hypothetical protein COL08_22990 [Priestia megaterium]
MMDLYTEIMKSNSLNKITVNLKSHRDYLYSGWEINQIGNSLNNVYYKNELINTLKALLLNGTDPEDIYILNQSVKIGKSYNFIKDGRLNLRSSRDIALLYYLGSPIPLVPNKDPLKIYNIFEIYRFLYKKCNSLGLNPPNRRYTLHELLENKSDIINAKLLKEYLKEKVYECNSTSETKEVDEKILKLFNSLDNSLKSFDSLFNDIELLDTFNEKYSSSIGEGLDVEKYKSLNKYFNFFFKTFNKLDRPFVCVYKREEQQLDVLCTDLISIKNFTEDNYRFFETKNISQNSPLTIAICIGLGFAPSLFKVGEALLLAKRNIVNAKNDLLQARAEIEETDSRIAQHNEELIALQKEIDDVNNEIREIENNTINNEVINAAKEVISNTATINEDINNFVNDGVNSLEEKNNENLKQTLKEKKLSIDNVTSRENEAS